MPKKSRARERKVEVAALPRLRPDVAGVDLGSHEHWVCAPAGAGERSVRVFRAVTSGLHELVGWLREQKVTSVAMESTHVYWIPLYELLEAAGIEVLLVNARQLHNVPGRKTDMADCQWLQLLHSCGLLRGSFRPGPTICRLRSLRRQMSNLVEARTRAVQWMQQSLDQMNVLVHRAVSDLTGHTGLAIVRAIVAGERDPKRLASLRDRRCRKSEDEIAEYLTGTWSEDHLFNLEMSLQLYDQLEAQLAHYEERILRDLEALQPPERQKQAAPEHPNKAKGLAMRRTGEDPLRHHLWRLAGVDLTRIDGISAPAARVILTEVGCDLSAFPDEHHFVSWLRLSPRTAYSAGKPLKKTRNSLGATRVAGVLRMAALSLRRSKTALGAYFRRIARRKDAAVAIFATARKLATLVFRMMRYGKDYRDLGEQHYEARFHQQRLHGLSQAAKQLGFKLVPDVATG